MNISSDDHSRMTKSLAKNYVNIPSWQRISFRVNAAILIAFEALVEGVRLLTDIRAIVSHSLLVVSFGITMENRI